jgi:hypothetical protein
MDVVDEGARIDGLGEGADFSEAVVTDRVSETWRVATVSV